MIIDRLIPEDYHLLEAVPDGFVPDPSLSIVVAAFDDGKIVGRTCFLQMGHIEGTWVDEEHRKGLTGYRMLKRLEQEAKNCGSSTAFAYAMDEKVEEYLERIGYKKQPLTVWAKELS